MKKIFKSYTFMVIIFLGILFLANKQLLSSQESDIRPHGSQYNLPELTPNNYLIGNLNENRSSYRVSFYDINIDFDIDHQSLAGFVTIKAESIRDLNQLQIDLAENLNIDKITYENQELSFSREFDAVLIDFSSTIKKGSMFEFTVFYHGVLRVLIILLGLVDLHGQKIKKDAIGLLFLVKVRVHEYGGLIKTIF